MSKQGSLHRLIDTFCETFRGLCIDVSAPQVERLAVTVHRAMTMQTRHYHNLDHVFSFFDSANPAGRMAALYHDIVYYQVDEGFAPEIREILAPLIREAEGEIFVADGAVDGVADGGRPHDRALRLTLDIFGFLPGQRLSPAAGLNEFLSALVMNEALAPFLPECELLKMTAYVEATIPFRDSDDNGVSHFEVLEERLHAISAQFGIPLTREELADTVRLAVWFSNKDVESFAGENTSKFVDDTWKLLPETNPALRSHGGSSYSIRDYRQALDKTELFLSALNPRSVFHCHRGTPTQAEFAHMVERACVNVQTARDYLRIKLVTAAILEGLAEATGGNAPLALFMGDIPQEGQDLEQITHFLPAVPLHASVDPASTVWELLDAGLPSQWSFDSRQSPLSAFVYRCIGPQGIVRGLACAREMFAGRLAPEAFLACIPPELLGSIARSSAEMVPTRRDLLMRFANPTATPGAPCASPDR